MSSKSPERTHLPDANPGVSGGKNPLRKDGSAVRACLGRHTVDIVSMTDGFLAVAGDGVGRSPVSALITPATVAVVLERADVVDARTVWETQAWPLAA